MKTRLALTVAAAFAASLAVATRASAQDAPSGPGANDGPAAPPAAPVVKDAVHLAWDEVRAAMDEMRAAGAAKDNAKLMAARAVVMQKQEAFKTAFAASDWEKIDPKADADLLGSGLQMLGNEAMSKDDGKSAVKIYETFLAKLGDMPAANMVRARMLPSAYLVAGDLPKAVAIWESGVKSDDLGTRCDALLNLGDLKAAQGDTAAAKASWQQIVDLPAGGPRDPATQMKPYAEIRLALVGSAAPEIDSKTWIDGEAKALSAHKGAVVVVDFWATWCPPCRGVMPGLSKLYDEKKKDGLVVLGVTRFYANGFLPKAGTKEPVTDGERVANIPEATYQDHLKQFKTNLAISYPFVTATEAEFKAYKISGIPTMVVIDRAGSVAFLKVGGGDETMLKIAVDRLLAAK